MVMELAIISLVSWAQKRKKMPERWQQQALFWAFLQVWSSQSQSKADINLKEESFQRAAMTVMVQLTTARRPASLQSMGFLKYQYRGVTNGLAKYYQQQYFPTLDVERVYDLLNELAMHFGYHSSLFPGLFLGSHPKTVCCSPPVFCRINAFCFSVLNICFRDSGLNRSSLSCFRIEYTLLRFTPNSSMTSSTVII